MNLYCWERERCGTLAKFSTRRIAEFYLEPSIVPLNADEKPSLANMLTGTLTDAFEPQD